MAVDEAQANAARNQSLFREVNEAIRAINDGGVPDAWTAEFLCECADLKCTEKIELTLGEYEGARRFPTRFPTAVGHEWPDVEHVVERNERFQVVEKYGEGGKVAVEQARA